MGRNKKNAMRLTAIHIDGIRHAYMGCKKSDNREQTYAPIVKPILPEIKNHDERIGYSDAKTVIQQANDLAVQDFSTDLHFEGLEALTDESRPPFPVLDLFEEQEDITFNFEPMQNMDTMCSSFND